MTAKGLLPSTSRRFFDWASTSPLSLPAAAARQRFIRLSGAADDPPAFLRLETEKLGVLRHLLSQLLHAASSEPVVLGRSAAELLSLLATGLPAANRDVVVLVEPNHPVAELSWLGAARRRHLRIISVPSDHSYRADLGGVRDAADSRCFAICVTHLTHLHGGVQPVAELAEIAHHVGAALIVDGAQAVGRIPVDLAELGCDAYIGVGRKALLAPIGTAFLAARDELLARVEPAVWSTRSARVTQGPHRTAQVISPPAGLEGSLPDLSALEALSASVQAILAIGVETIQRHIQAVLPTLSESLARRGLRQISPASDNPRNAGILTFSLPDGTNGPQLQARLRNSGYVVAADDRNLRVSIHMANDDDDVEALAEEVYRNATSGC